MKNGVDASRTFKIKIMGSSNRIGYITFMLSLVAGYCDTVTFVGAHEVFSAHVTGNFILFAYQLVTGADHRAWIKLLTLPVFILSVIVCGRLDTNLAKKERLLLFEGGLLSVPGILPYYSATDGNRN